MSPKIIAKKDRIIQLYLLIQINEAWPLNIIKRTKKVIILLCTLRVLALIDKFKSNFSSLLNDEEVIFLPLGIITKNTLKNIIQPKIMPTDKNANRGPKIFVKQKEITTPITNKTNEKIILLFIKK